MVALYKRKTEKAYPYKRVILLDRKSYSSVWDCTQLVEDWWIRPSSRRRRVAWLESTQSQSWDVGLYSYLSPTKRATWTNEIEKLGLRRPFCSLKDVLAIQRTHIECLRVRRGTQIHDADGEIFATLPLDDFLGVFALGMDLLRFPNQIPRLCKRDVKISKPQDEGVVTT